MNSSSFNSLTDSHLDSCCKYGNNAVCTFNSLTDSHWVNVSALLDMAYHNFQFPNGFSPCFITYNANKSDIHPFQFPNGFSRSGSQHWSNLQSDNFQFPNGFSHIS